MTQWVEPVPNTEVPGSVPVPHKLSEAVHTCDPSTWGKGRGLEVQGHPCLQKKAGG